MSKGAYNTTDALTPLEDPSQGTRPEQQTHNLTDYLATSMDNSAMEDYLATSKDNRILDDYPATSLDTRVLEDYPATSLDTRILEDYPATSLDTRVLQLEVENSTDTVTARLRNNFCAESDQAIFFYLTVIFGSLLTVFVILFIIFLFLVWRKFIRKEDMKKVSRAESWRYESSLYVNPGRHKPAVPVYVPSPTLPFSQPNQPSSQPVISQPQYSQPLHHEEHSRHSRLLNADVIEEESSNYNTLERLSAEGSTRAATPQITPHQSPLLVSRRGSQGGWSRNSTLNGHLNRSGTPGTSPIGTPQTSPLLQRSRAFQQNGHNRTGSLSTALRGVDIIRCTTPGHPPPSSSPANNRRRQISLGDRGISERASLLDH